MVAKAIGRPAAPRPEYDENALEPGLRENITRQLQPLLQRLKNRWVLFALFITAYIPFGMMYMGEYQDYTRLQSRISAQEAVLALPEPRTDDIESGLTAWSDALTSATQAQNLELEHSELVERLLAASVGTGVKIESISSSSNEIIPLGQEAYDVTPILVRVTGGLAAIESFIAVLENDAIGALEVKNSLVTPTEGEFAATVRVVVFNRPVDPSELNEEEREALSRRVTDEELDAAASGGRQ